MFSDKVAVEVDVGRYSRVEGRLASVERFAPADLVCGTNVPK
jgi:hypothetical protein